MRTQTSNTIRTMHLQVKPQRSLLQAVYTVEGTV